MKSKFTDIFIQRPVLSIVVSLLVLFIGLISINKMQLRQWPYLTQTTIEVTTAYPGANAQVVQGFVTNPLQKKIASAEGIDYMKSSSTLGSSTIDCIIKTGYDPERAFTDISAKVAEAAQLVSQQAQKSIIIKKTGSQTPSMILNAHSPTMSPTQINDYLTRVVVPIIQSIDGVADVSPLVTTTPCEYTYILTRWRPTTSVLRKYGIYYNRTILRQQAVPPKENTSLFQSIPKRIYIPYHNLTTLL